MGEELSRFPIGLPAVANFYGSRVTIGPGPKHKGVGFTGRRFTMWEGVTII